MSFDALVDGFSAEQIASANLSPTQLLARLSTIRMAKSTKVTEFRIRASRISRLFCSIFAFSIVRIGGNPAIFYARRSHDRPARSARRLTQSNPKPHSTPLTPASPQTRQTPLRAKGDQAGPPPPRPVRLTLSPLHPSQGAAATPNPRSAALPSRTIIPRNHPTQRLRANARSDHAAGAWVNWVGVF